MSEQNQLSVELTGTVIAVEEPKEYGAKHFRKAQIAIEVNDGKFAQKLAIEAAGKNADLFAEAGVVIGDTVAVRCNLQGREWNGRYFVSLSAWKCDVQGERRREDVPPKSNVVQDTKDIFGGVELDEGTPF
jgi:hypothetical protein